MEQRVTRWNGEGPEGTDRFKERRELKELRGTRWNGEAQDGTGGAQDGTEEHKLELMVTRWNGEGPEGTEGLEVTERARRNGWT